MLRTFNVIISKVENKFIASCEDMLLNGGEGIEQVEDMFDILRNCRGLYERATKELALVRVFMKDESNPVRVF